MGKKEQGLVNISAPKLLFRKLDCCCVFELNHLLLSGKHNPIKAFLQKHQQLLMNSVPFWKIFFCSPLITAHHRPQRRVGESRGPGSRMLCFTLEKQKLEIRSPYISPCFLLPQKGQQVSQGCSYSAMDLYSPPHFSRWTITALRRLACCSVWLSSDSSMLGKVVMRTNSLAAMAGRAATTNCRRSDTLWVWLNF